MRHNLSYPINWYDKNSNKHIRLCCCQPEIPHDETQKFMIVKRDFEREKRLAGAEAPIKKEDD